MRSYHFLITAPHPVRVDHAFGNAGGARSKENPDDRVGVRVALSVLQARSGGRVHQIGEERRSVYWILRYDDLRVVWHDRADCPLVLFSAGSKDETRRQKVHDVAQFPEIR